MVMEHVIKRQIQKYYPTGTQTHKFYYTLESTPILPNSPSPTWYQKLSNELRDSNYAAASLNPAEFLAQCQIKHTYTTQRCTVHVVTTYKDDPPKLLMLRVLRRLECLLDIFNVRKQLTFWLLPTPSLRKFPKASNVHISPQHINGGFTYPELNTVYVFRNEEFPKVFVHETLHHTHIDMHSHWDRSKTELQKLYAYFHLDTNACNSAMQCYITDIRPNEAWVEVWADIYHIAFLHHEYGIPWSVLWSREREWACVQAKRVLAHQHKQADGQWRETTHSFSYMVLRAALLWSAPKLVSMMNPSSRTTEQITNQIVSCYEDKSFQLFLRKTQLPRHLCFRMTVFGDL